MKMLYTIGAGNINRLPFAVLIMTPTIFRNTLCTELYKCLNNRLILANQVWRYNWNTFLIVTSKLVGQNVPVNQLLTAVLRTKHFIQLGPESLVADKDILAEAWLEMYNKSVYFVVVDFKSGPKYERSDEGFIDIKGGV